MALERATFAAGCFWGVEEAFRRLPGVRAVRSGYTGGTAANPSYEQVCTGRTGHAEAVDVEFDPSAISYAQLLEAFWNMHDPTTKDRQGPDIGTQYRSAVFFHSPEQERAARESLAALDQSGRLRRSAVTEITAARPFYPAEEYHQQYLRKHGGSCHI
jgi:peptide-methionine (S)-S-oxide reductase